MEGDERLSILADKCAAIDELPLTGRERDDLKRLVVGGYVEGYVNGYAQGIAEESERGEGREAAERHKRKRRRWRRIIMAILGIILH